ncbi:MAG TPA: hypothetical protein VHP83_21090 [Aggregatilineaceae bacterium]|nr:hypothetical protein [Aggregatilineaceae bacterium]
MTIAQPTLLLDEITDFLASSPAPQEIVSFKPSEVLERRALDLLQLNRENRLTMEERAEMEEFMRMDHFMTLLKAKARLKLAGKT